MVERKSLEAQIPLYQERRAVVKAINKFWPVAIMHDPELLVHVAHTQDQTALSYLEDLWVEFDPKEVRAFTLEFVSAERWFSELTNRLRSLLAALQREPIL